jgi:hypothetical protein
MSIIVQASFINAPTSEPGILGIKVVSKNPIVRPIHIALVLDTSGSMEGSRIETVKNTLSVLVNRLLVGDKITVISFSSTAKTLLSQVTVSETNRTELTSIIGEINADGGTNIESGIAQLGGLFTSADSAHPDSIVLLTDGFINEGITSVAGLYSMLNSYMPGVPVYALGYGDDHNADFMKGLSLRTNGTYTFIDNEIALPASIGDLLGGLQGEVAKNAELIIPTDWTCLELNYVNESTTFGIGSLIADKPTWIMFSVPVNSPSQIQLRYKNVSDGTSVHTMVNISNDLERIEVCEQYMRCLSAVSLDKASNFIKNGQLTAANLEISVMIDKITKSEAARRPLAIRMKAQLAEMSEQIQVTLQTPPRIRRNGNSHMNLLLRTSSTASRYGQQRGVSSNGDVDIFSSPQMLERTSQMVNQYTQNSVIFEDPDNVHDQT